MGARTLIMGVLNVTPDSFYDGGRYFKLNRAIDRGLQLEEEGADILDVGGESTHPRSRAVPAAEEIKRVVPVIEALRHRLTIPISVDTYKSAVARPAIAAGAEIVNDVGGLRLDPDLAHLVSASNAAVILMHSRGTRDSMHSLPRAQNILRVVMEGLSRSVQKAISSGIGPNRIIVDPGLGLLAWQAVVATFLGLLFYVRKSRQWVLGLFKKPFRGLARPEVQAMNTRPPRGDLGQ